MAHEIKKIVCMGEGRGGRERKMWFIYFKLCVWGRGGGTGEGTGKVIHLFQTALKNLANKYFHFGQFLALSPVV